MRNLALIGTSVSIVPRYLNAIQDTNNNLLGSFDGVSVMYGYFPNAELDANKDVISLKEKPNTPKSNYAVSEIELAKNVQPFNGSELELTSVKQKYLEEIALKLEVLSRGFTWLDTGSHEALTEATEFIKGVEKSTRLKIACLEEIAINYNWISKTKVEEYIKGLKGDYYKYIENNLN